MYNILVGKQRSLVFPVMCNAHVTIPYAENVADTNSNSIRSDDVGYGLWSHEGRFTFEAIVTPYDVNGYGTQSDATKKTVANSKKIMPALSKTEYTAQQSSDTYLSDLYLERDDRIDHEMRIFHSDNFKLSLINDTKHNENEPANYKIKASLTLAGSTENFTSSYAISPATSKRFFYTNDDNFTGFNARGMVEYEKITTTTSGSTTTVINCSATTNFFGGDKQEVYIRDGFTFTSLGTITSKTSSSITLTSAHSEALGTGVELYLPIDKDPIYVNNFFHVACSLTDTNEIRLFINNREVLLGNHTDTSTKFTFGESDIYIGANGSASIGQNSAKTNNQFMGEMHEMSIVNLNRLNFPSITSLHPNFNNCLLYLRFEEVDV